MYPYICVYTGLYVRECTSILIKLEKGKVEGKMHFIEISVHTTLLCLFLIKCLAAILIMYMHIHIRTDMCICIL